MTRTRKTVGRISFVGAGPGDPGLVTRRAHEAVRAAQRSQPPSGSRKRTMRSLRWLANAKSHS